MAVTLTLAGDTMLGRGVAERLRDVPANSLFAPEVVAFARQADLVVINLECCISDRGTPWPDPGKPFFFRAPPVAVEALTHLGVDCVTLANNHALDFGERALLDTFRHLEGAGIAWVGAGTDLASARNPAVLEAGGSTVAVVGLTDHPAAFAAGDGPGVAYADLRSGTADWVTASVASVDAEVVLVSPHWGPNMTTRPLPHVLRAADDLVAAGATAVAGHSAHLFHGVRDRVLFDLGDFLDDYAVDPVLRNDLSLVWRATFEAGDLNRLEALPLRLEYCFSRPADREEAAWIVRRLRSACEEFGTEVTAEDGVLVIEFP